MVVLNFFGKVDTICVSEKLKLFISNLPEKENNNWKTELQQELLLAEEVDNLSRQKLGMAKQQHIKQLYSRVFPNKGTPKYITDTILNEIVDNMVCLYFDYEYDDMPLGGWDTNCFDNRFCEEDGVEKIIDFISFLSHGESKEEQFPCPVPQWIYSSNHFEIDHYRMFWGGSSADSYIKSLIQWGELFDRFLVDKNDYLQLNYLFDSIHKDKNYNEYHLFKAYALCQLFLEKNREKELDYKLPLLIENGSFEDKNAKAILFRELRNKIAHGDFVAFEEKVEEYAQRFMDGQFNFDYSEYSRRNWVVEHVCCELDDLVRKLIHLLLNDKNSIEEIKNSNNSDK